MKKTLLASALLFSAAIAAPAFADSHVTPYPGLEGLECVALIEKLDVTLEEVQVPDELKVQMLELREKGLAEKTAGDEVACTTSLTAAFQLLVPSE
jgi:hypothetical protein